MPYLYNTLLAPLHPAGLPAESYAQLAGALLGALVDSPGALISAAHPTFPLGVDLRGGTLPEDEAERGEELLHHGLFDTPAALEAALRQLLHDQPLRAICVWFPGVAPHAESLLADLDLDDAEALECVLALVINPTPHPPGPSSPEVEPPWPEPLGPLPHYLELFGPRAPIDDEVLYSGLARALEPTWGPLRAATSVPGMQRYDM